MPIFHKNRQNLQSAKTDKSQQILQDQTTENHSIFCQNIENAVEPKTKKSAFFATKKSTPINKKHPQKNLTSNQTPTPAPRKKFLKIFAAASLALITCATTLLATTPFGSGAASAAAESEMTAQEKLAAGKLNLNPDTDPTIYTTESGLEIKFKSDTIGVEALSGHAYVTIGTYDGEPVNWIVIGISSSFGLTDSFEVWNEGNGPVGIAIKRSLLESAPTSSVYINENSEEVILTLDAITDSTLPSGSILAISEYVYTTSNWATCKEGGVDNFTPDDAGLARTACAAIAKTMGISSFPYIIKNHTINGYSNADAFLMTSGQVATFLPTVDTRIVKEKTTEQPVSWWTVSSGGRSSCYGRAYAVTASGNIELTQYGDANGTYSTPRYVRPACLLKFR